MTVRDAVRVFVALGPMPRGADASPAELAELEARLRDIKPPVSDDEATALLGSFGPDACTGLAWVLVMLIESAPAGAPIDAEPPESASPWLRLLWDRSDARRAIQRTRRTILR